MQRRSARARKAADPLPDAVDQVQSSLPSNMASTSRGGQKRASTVVHSDIVPESSEMTISKRARKTEPSQPSGILANGDPNGPVAAKKRKSLARGKSTNSSKSFEQTSIDTSTLKVKIQASTTTRPTEAEDSSDDDDAEAIAKLLIRPVGHSIPSTSYATHTQPSTCNNNKGARHTAGVTENQPLDLSILSELSIPKIDDQYDSAEDFIHHVKELVEKTGHNAFQQGGQGKLKCKMICRNWKKLEYNPPGLACTFHFLAKRSEETTIWTVISAQSEHNLACIKHEQDQRATEANSSSPWPKLTKRSSAREVAATLTQPTRNSQRTRH